MNKYTKVNVSGDGSCYFHSIIGFLGMEKKIKKGKTYYEQGNASALRKRVVNWLRNNLNYKLPNGLTIQDDILDDVLNNRHIHDESVTGYIEHMSKYDSYAGQIEITATANILKRSIRVYILDQGKYKSIGLGYEINSNKKNDITLFHNMKRGISKGDHFEILFPKSLANVVTKRVYDKLKSGTKLKAKRKSNTKRKARPKNKRTKRKSRRP